ncbi:MAG: Uma2 family endonuclease [Cytophagales bacterium]|nr:Uma2 family endonuclease [Armatimonadota bacterium]
MWTEGSGLLRLPPVTDDEFWEFCHRNPLLQVERNAEGDILLMAPADSWTASSGSDLLGDLVVWNRAQGEPGIVFGPSAGFKLPNGADRSPDISWVERSRWEAIPGAERRPFARVSPDFVVEVMSPSDRAGEARSKVEEYAANGVRLGWLVDLKHQTVTIYRAGSAPEVVDAPARLDASPDLPGFIADMTRVFRRDTGE